MPKTIEELSDIGTSINTIITESRRVILHTGLRKEDLDAFEEYLEHQDTVMPLLNPTEYMHGGAKAIPIAQSRVEAIRKMMEVL
jgi:hypothetical protein